MKKSVVFLFITIICIVIGCSTFTTNNSKQACHDEISFDFKTISSVDIEKISLGLTMDEVTELLGPGIVGDPPFIALLYSSDDGGTYGILFFEFQDANTFGEFKNGVTGIYYSKDSKGYFFLPEEIKGNTWEEVIPVSEP